MTEKSNQRNLIEIIPKVLFLDLEGKKHNYRMEFNFNKC